jgi:mono/diheme cytochrome c family protein
MRRTSLHASLATLLLAPLLACGTQKTAEAPETGEASYKRLCARCHGPDGRGDGSPGTDLTTGHLDVAELMQVIDGRTTVRAHGTAEMPVWGAISDAMHANDPHGKRITLHKVQTLAEYVAGLQAKAD